MAVTIHPSAIVHPSAIIGEDAYIGPYVIVGNNVKIGNRVRIESHAVIEYTELGDDCVIFPFASLGLPPQHLKYKGEPTRVVVGNRCTFRENVTVHRGTPLDKNITVIGNECYFMALSHIAHDCRVGNNVTMANGAMLAGHVEVGDNAFISAVAGIHQFVRIGKGAMISGGSMVPMDVAPFCIAQGDRASIKGLNKVGLKRMGLKLASIKHLKNAYRTVFLSQQPLQMALKSPDLLVDDPSVKTFREFLSTPKRGFIRPNSTVQPLEEDNNL